MRGGPPLFSSTPISPPQVTHAGSRGRRCRGGSTVPGGPCTATGRSRGAGGAWGGGHTRCSGPVSPPTPLHSPPPCPPQLTRGTTSAPRAPRCAPAAGGRRSPRGGTRSPAPPAAGSHCGDGFLGCGGGHITPPALPQAHLCLYLASFSSSQAVLPPPKPSCSVRSSPWAWGGAAEPPVGPCGCPPLTTAPPPVGITPTLPHGERPMHNWWHRCHPHVPPL